MFEDPGIRAFAIFGAVLLLAAGIGLLFFVRRRWFGRYRQWSVNESHGSFTVYVAPPFAIGAILGGAALICRVLVDNLLITRILLAAAMVTPVVGVILSTIEPRWWGPRWYHEVQHELWYPNQEEYEGGRGAVPAPGVELSSPELAAKIFDGQPVAESCRCYLIHEPNKGLHKYGVRHVVQLSGSLEVRPTGLAFVPGRFTEKARGGPHVVPIDADEVERVWVVPPGAEPDGYRRLGLPRELWSRIVVKTEEETFLFSVPKAQERAKTISEVLGCPLGT